jgi:hypothetical protein
MLHVINLSLMRSCIFEISSVFQLYPFNKFAIFSTLTLSAYFLLNFPSLQSTMIISIFRILSFHKS